MLNLFPQGDTSDYFFAGNNSTDDNLSPVSTTRAMKQLQRYQLAYTSKLTHSEKLLYVECKQQPNSISTKKKKLPVKNIFHLLLSHEKPSSQKSCVRLPLKYLSKCTSPTLP
jgi:hypothetical protein